MPPKTLFCLTYQPVRSGDGSDIKSGFKRRVYGICDAPSELIRELPAILGCEERPQRGMLWAEPFLWFTHFTVRGKR